MKPQVGAPARLSLWHHVDVIQRVDQGLRGKRQPLWPLLLVIGSAGSGVLLAALGFVDPIELQFRDALLRLAPAHAPASVAVLAIDDDSLAQHGPWPWERGVLAELVLASARGGARAVAVDLLLVEPRPTDTQLARALAGLPSVQAVAPGQDGWLLPSPDLRHAALLAHAAFDPDRDGVVRRLSATKQAAGSAYPAFPLAVTLLVEAGRYVPIGTVLRPDFRIAWNAMPIISAREVLSGALGDRFAQKIVFVGVTASGLGDRAHTPTSPRGASLPGVIIHAGIAECLLARSTLSASSPLAGGLTSALFVFSALLLSSRLGPRQRFFAALALLPAPTAVTALALFGLRHELPLLLPTSLTALALLAGELSAARRTSAAASRVAATLGAASGTPFPGGPATLDRLEVLASEIAARRAAESEARRVMAHELRTPLTSVRGLTQLLADYDLTPTERRRVASLAVHETRRLQEMIEGLLSLERLGLRDLEAVGAPIDLGTLVAQRVALLAETSGHEIRLDCSAGVYVKGDAELLRRVTDNLIGNALSYSPPATRVHVRVEPAGGSALLTVADRGPGVPPEERERVFARFARGTSSAGTQGLGLGLAMVAEAAAWHRGRVDVTDTPGGGATFVFRVPLLAPKEG